MTRPIALVTGASSGIGEELAKQLGATGHDLVLVARREKTLQAVADELERSHGAHAEILVADLADRAGVDAVAARIKDLDPAPVDIVVNCAGFGSYGPFWDLPTEGEVDEVLVNVLALLVLSQAALSAMVPRRHGAILNVSSTAGFQPGPGSATYAATKAFVTSFTESLHEEAAPHGIKVTALCPGFTRTNFQERASVRTSRLPSFIWADAATVAAAGLRALSRNQAVCVPGLPNRITAIASRLGPRGAVRKISGIVARRLVG